MMATPAADSMCAIARSGRRERGTLAWQECMWPGPRASLL